MGISNLTLENILNTDQRAKFIEETNAISIITKSIEYNTNIDKVNVDQISFVLLKNTLISFQEKNGSHFEDVRNRIRNKTGKIKKHNADYLLYCLIDSLTENYFINLEKLGIKIEELEH